MLLAWYWSKAWVASCACWVMKSPADAVWLPLCRCHQIMNEYNAVAATPMPTQTSQRPKDCQHELMAVRLHRRPLTVLHLLKEGLCSWDVGSGVGLVLVERRC